MKHRLLLGAGLSFAAAWAGFQLYASQLEEKVAGGPKVAVLVVTEDLSAGMPLTEERLASIGIPSSYLDARRVEEKDRKEVLGAELATELKAGQGLVWSDVANAVGRQRLSLVLPRGRRAYTLPASVNPMGSLLRSDDEVDVLLVESGAAELLLEKVRVLGVGAVLRGTERENDGVGSRRADSVTVDVSLKQAQELMAAMEKGELQLVLRHPDDEAFKQPLPVAERLPTTRPTRRAPKAEIEHVR